ncbi:MAG TPA: Ig-like domain-containing protein [Spirochaetota bacterium]|nr:Ig-like domain-containing protein [Spirochaetota bacterium]HPI87979.1 Ig-like domain-containing protein [Spirochaetota bacterium]HPR46690.1 Ig-like domain-containing protein [Spirochaetota bacterium]
MKKLIVLVCFICAFYSCDTLKEIDYNNPYDLLAGRTSVNSPKVSFSPESGSDIVARSTLTLGFSEAMNRDDDWSLRYSEIDNNFTEETSSASWSSRESHTSVVFDNNIWVLGGSNKNDVWHSEDGVNWTEATSSAPWSGRSNHANVIFNNKIWVLGGYDWDSSVFSRDVWYSMDGVNWTEATSSAQWMGRHSHSCVVFNNKIWVLGGNFSYPINDVWRSEDGINWAETTSSAPWAARYEHASVVYDNKIWVLGGYSNWSDYHNDVWYSEDGVNWTEATSSAPWSARCSHTAVVYDNMMWIIGGKEDGSRKNDIWYSVDGVNWTEAASSALWTARCEHASVVYDDKIWVLGGDYSNDVYSYTPFSTLHEYTKDSPEISWEGNQLILKPTGSIASGTLVNVGLYDFSAARDNCLLSGVTSAIYTVCTDSTDPVVEITSPADSDTVTGTVAVAASASDNYEIDYVEFYIEGTLAATDETEPYEYQWNSLAESEGDYVIEAVAYDISANSASASVTVTVDHPDDIIDPEVEITSPSDGGTVSGMVTVTASASDNTGVASVAFYIAGSLAYTDTSAPYAYSWDTTGVSDGSVTITATAYDASGNDASDSVTVTVDNVTEDVTDPTVTITAPSDSTEVSDTITITASASDNVGVTSVEFYVAGSLVSTDTSSPYEYSWNTTGVSNGSYAVTATAYDASGNDASDSVTVTVNNITEDTTDPTVAITAPSDSAEVSDTITITASASDNVGVTSVEFYVAGSLVSTDTSAPYAYSWNTTGVSDGSVTITAIAYDASGNDASDSVTVTVNNDFPNDYIAWYPFNGNANDESGNGLNGTVNGAILTSDRDSNSNSAYDFDGSNDYIYIGNPSELTGMSALTVSVWVYTHSAPSPNSSIIVKGDGTNTSYGFGLADTSGTISFNCNYSGSITSTTIDFNTWVHLLLVWNGSTAQMYYNNSIIGSMSCSGTISGSEVLSIGRCGSWTSWAYFDGIIDDVRIYDRALTADEIEALYTE